MKKFILSVFMGVATMLATAQTITYEQLDCDRAQCKEYKDVDYTAYIASDGHTYAIGDTILLGFPSGQHTSVTSNGNGTAIGGTYSNYQTIISSASIAAAALGAGMTYMSNRNGEYYVIRHIDILCPRKNATTGATIQMKGYVRGVGEVYIQNFEAAISLGEIQTQGITREQAIQILQEKKSLLDLQIISQEEYDQIKNELIPYIK